MNRELIVRERFACVVALVGLAALASACSAHRPGSLPSAYVNVAHASRLVVDGATDDLLTAGLGLEGLRSPVPPGFADPLHPTAAELRRRAVWSNWRALIDLAPDGGAGRLFGPGARPDARVAGGDDVPRGIAGIERLGALQLDGSRQLDAVLLQIPANFDPGRPCLIAVASSGSRGVYGALPTAGEWGLRSGCAVVTTDKGTAVAFLDATLQPSFRIDGTRTTGPDDPLASFVPPSAATPRAVPAAGVPAGPWLYSKHAHSGADPEPRWGERLIAATQVAFDWLNEEYGARLPRPLGPGNTTVIASGISNGGAVVLRALELDRGPPATRWFDGAVVAEPNAIVARVQPRLVVATGAGARREIAVRSLLDYASLHALLQPCAVLAPVDAGAPLAAAVAAGRAIHEGWCADLAAHGEVVGADAPARAADARARLLAAGVEPGALALGPVNVSSQLWLSIVTTYLHAHAAALPGEHPCALAFAAVDASGAPRAPTEPEWRRLPADGSGIPPGAGIGIVRVDGAPVATPATVRCVRDWIDGTRATAGVAPDFGARLRAGLEAIQMNATPGDRPVVVLHGRIDGLIPVNHASRPWYAAARARAPQAELRYYEIEHAQHFDAFLGLPGFAGAFVPVQPYLLAAMDLMAARLHHDAALPPSQVLRSKPRTATATGALAALAHGNLGEIRPAPPAADRIELRDGVLVVPD